MKELIYHRQLLPAVSRHADRVLAFHDGTVIADGTPQATLADAKVQALIVGTRLNLGPQSERPHA